MTKPHSVMLGCKVLRFITNISNIDGEIIHKTLVLKQERAMNISGKDAVYFHINRVVPWSSLPKWKIGDVIDIGGESNPYFSFFETNQKNYEVAAPNKVLYQLPAKLFLQEVRDGKIDCQDVARIATDITQHFVSYVRELIWEDIRKSEFPHLPSRLCQRQFKFDPLIDVIAEVKLTHPCN